MKIAKYQTDLSDAQWAFLEPMIAKPSKRGRPRGERRSFINAVLYLVKGGIPWRLLPVNFPPWQTVYHVFRQWSVDHTWESINARLRAYVRGAAGKHCRPTAALLDSQSVKSDGHGGTVGFDAAKLIKGRKRHVLVDTLGLLLGVFVTPASTPERDGAKGCWRQSWATSNGCVCSGWTADIPGRPLRNGSKHADQNWKSRSSNAPITCKDSKCFLAGG